MVISLISGYRVTFNQYNYLQSLTGKLSKADYKLFCHLFVSTITHFRQVHENSNGWLSIPKRFIQDKFRTSDPENLKRLGLIDIDRRYVTGKRPRRYCLKDWVLEGYLQASIQDISSDRHLVSIVTGKLLPERKPESPDGSSLPPLVRAAIQRLRACYFDRPAVLEHLERLRATYKQTPTARNRFRYLNDWLIMDVIDKLAKPTDNPKIYILYNNYTEQSTGRIGTPLQSASRAMKQAAYGSIEDVHNYDLSSSQMALCLREFKRHGISCPWLETYLNDSDLRSDYARYIGVSIDTFKTCLYTILMTGYIPTNTTWQGSPVVEALEEEVSNSTKLVATLARLRETLKPLAQSLKQWHKIIESGAKESGKVRNILGLTRPYSDFDKTSGMVAHLLQGMEAYFIHTITLLADKHGFEPIGNEHDGLITIGSIPAEAIQEVQSITGLHCLELREKPFN